MILGIDPGKTSGGVCLMDHNGFVCFILKMPPTLQFAHDVREFLQVGSSKLFAFVEAAQSFPGQGIASTFGYGTHFGEILGVLTALEVPFELVRPGVWTKEMLSGTLVSKNPKKGDKSRNIDAARRLFPDQPEIRVLKPHTGIVDALLICEYGRRKRQAGLKEVG